MSRTHAIRLAFAILAIGFFATPIAARVLGVTAEQFENRRFADPPELSQGWDAFPQATQFLVDRMPLRKQAVEANTHIWTGVFGTDPNYAGDGGIGDDRALPFAGTAGVRDEAKLAAGLGDETTAKAGRAGWLFADTEFELGCGTGYSGVLRRWGRVVRAIRESGRPAAMFVPPAKASVYPEHLPDEYRSRRCVLDDKERFWALLSEQGPALGVFELRSELLRLKPYAGDALFYRKDTHWSTLGALTLVRAVLRELGDGIRLEADEIVKRGSVAYTGDLTVLRGQAETDRAKDYAISRAPGAPRVPGRTLIICDSFACKWLRLLRPYFERIEQTNVAVGAPATLRMIRRADRVIIESMETLWKTMDDSQELLEEFRWLPI